MIATHPPTQEEVADLFAATACRQWAKASPLTYVHIADPQKHDQPLHRLLCEYPDNYKETTYCSGEKEYTLIIKENKMILPKMLQESGVKWYHKVLMHPGKT